jgi:hypothetical protein
MDCHTEANHGTPPLQRHHPSPGTPGCLTLTCPVWCALTPALHPTQLPHRCGRPAVPHEAGHHRSSNVGWSKQYQRLEMHEAAEDCIAPYTQWGWAAHWLTWKRLSSETGPQNARNLAAAAASSAAGPTSTSLHRRTGRQGRVRMGGETDRTRLWYAHQQPWSPWRFRPNHGGACSSNLLTQ